MRWRQRLRWHLLIYLFQMISDQALVFLFPGDLPSHPPPPPPLRGAGAVLGLGEGAGFILRISWQAAWKAVCK